MKKTIALILSVVLSVSLLLSGCGGDPSNTTDPAGNAAASGTLEYNLDSGEDFTIQVSLGGATECVVFLGDTKLDKTEFTVGADSVTISSYSLMFLEVNQTYPIKIEAGGKAQEFSVKIISTSNLSLDDSAVSFDFKNPQDIVKSADFGDQTIENIRLGAKDYADPAMYSYDGSSKTLTLKKEMIMALPGTTNIMIRLSSGKEFAFDVTNTLLAAADFEAEGVAGTLTAQHGIFWGSELEIQDDGTGNHIGKLNPEYDHLFAFGDHYWGNIGGVEFEQGATYKVEFDIKPAEESTVKYVNLYLRKAFESYDPRCGIDPSGEGDDVQKYCKLDFADGTCKTDGNMDVTCTYNEATGFTHITVTFKTSTAYDTIFNCNTGSFYYDGDRPGETGLTSDPTNAENKAAYESAKGIFWYFDNLTVIKQ